MAHNIAMKGSAQAGKGVGSHHFTTKSGLTGQNNKSKGSNTPNYNTGPAHLPQSTHMKAKGLKMSKKGMY